MTFTKHFEEILECCNEKFHCLRIFVNKKWDPSPETILQIYKQCVRPIFEYGIVSTIIVSETVITKIQRVQNSFISLELHLPKYVSPLYGDLLSYYPHIKFLGITLDNRMTFTKHFEEILECCNEKFHCLRIFVNKKWDPSPETILQIYKQCVRPIFEYGIVSTIIVSETVITKIQRVQNSFIRLELHLPKYVSAGESN